MDFVLRDAQFSDIAEITAIYADSVVTGTSSYELIPPDQMEMEARYQAIISKGYPYIVGATPDGTLLGYSYASAFKTRPAYRWVVEDSIYLRPEARGKGIGKALLSELAGRCAQLGFRQMIAVIGGANPASIAVHKTLGFEMAGTLKGTGFKHGRWLDTVLMQMALGDGMLADPDPHNYPGTLWSD